MENGSLTPKRHIFRGIHLTEIPYHLLVHRQGLNYFYRYYLRKGKKKDKYRVTARDGPP